MKNSFDLTLICLKPCRLPVAGVNTNTGKALEADVFQHHTFCQEYLPEELKSSRVKILISCLHMLFCRCVGLLKLSNVFEVRTVLLF